MREPSGPREPAPRFEDLVSIGAVVRPQGRKGEVLVEPLSDRPDRFPSLRRAWLPSPGGWARQVRVESVWSHKGRFVLKLEGVDSIDAAEQLRGQELRIEEAELERLPAGSYYHHQLRGLRVQDPSGSELGRVEDVMAAGPGTPVLVVRGSGGEVLVPLAEDFVRRVDLQAGLLVALRPEPVDAGD